MKPEDIDKLFRERLGGLPRTPSSDAWQRLQDQLQPPPKKKVIPMWWSIAATVAFLLLMGFYLYLNQSYQPAPVEIAGTGKPAQESTRPAGTTRPDAGPGPELVKTPELVAEAAPKEAREEKPVKDLKPLPEPAGLIAATRPAAAPVRGTVTPSPTKLANEELNHAKDMRADQVIEEMETPTMIALDQPAIRPGQVNAPAIAPAPETIEVMILKEEPSSLLAEAGEEAETNPSRKGKIVRGIFKQVKNIAAGEKVDLSEVGLDRYSIAFETQIGNRKISKRINF